MLRCSVLRSGTSIYLLSLEAQLKVSTCPPSVVFYISGHGFGHAIRQIAVINALHELAPDISIVVRTAAPEWLFTRTACGGRSSGCRGG